MAMKKLMTSSAILFLGVAALISCHPTMAQSTATTANTVTASDPSENSRAANGSVPDLSGIWELRSDSRRQLDQAQLTRGAIRAAQGAAALIRAGHTIVPASRWCHYKGVPFMMGQSPPIDIIQTKDEIAIFAEQISSPRHVYIDG